MLRTAIFQLVPKPTETMQISPPIGFVLFTVVGVTALVGALFLRVFD